MTPIVGDPERDDGKEEGQKVVATEALSLLFIMMNKNNC
jgi:hypothetical protein